MKKIIIFSFVLIIMISLAFTSFAAQKKLTFIMVPKGIHPYYEPCFEGFKAAGAKYGVNVDWVNPQKFEIALQVKVIEDLIAQKVDGITISALDDAGLVAVIDDAVKAGIKVITFDAPAFSTKALTYIGTDNESAGYAAGKKMADIMGKSGKLIILQGGLGASNLNSRTKGFKKAIAEAAPKIQILDVVDVQGDFSVATNKTEAILQTYPDLKGIFAVSAEGAPAASNVVKQQNKKGKVLVAGFDDLKDTLEGIKDGTVSFCLVQKCYKMGWLSVEKLLDAVNGKSIQKIIDTGVLVVEKKNVSTYMADLKKEFSK